MEFENVLIVSCLFAGYNALHLAVMQSHVKAIRRLNDIGCSMDVQVCIDRGMLVGFT